jgi:type II secretory pathway component PulM
MNQGPNRFLERLSAYTSKVKALLTKDYSVQDLQNLPASIKQWWINVSYGVELAAIESTQNQGNDANSLALKSNHSFDAKHIWQSLRRIIFQQRKILFLLLMLLISGMLYRFLLAPYSLRVQDQLDLRPAQWSQLQSLIRISKSSAAGGNAVTSNGMPSTVSLLDEQEMQKILNVFSARGLKPSVFRLSTDNPPRIEFQASEVMFSVLLDVLEELRTTWRLYPIQLSVVSNGGAGMVNVSGVLSQYGSNANNAAEQGVAQ